MAQNYDLNNTGPEVQARLDQVFPNRDAISEETGQREQGDVDLSSALEAEINRAQGAESELQSQVNDTYRKSETYTKEEVNGLITTPDQQFVSVVATSQTEEAEDVLPDVGAPNTIYRVGNWDGAAYDISCYSEYAWDGSEYVPLSVKSFGIDDVPTPNSENLVKSGGVAGVTHKLTNTNYLLSSCKGNVYDKSYIRANKGIYNNDSGARIVDMEGSYITGFYKIPDEADTIVVDGCLGASLYMRFSNEPKDDASQKWAVSMGTGVSVNIAELMEEIEDAHPDWNIKYVCFAVYRETQEHPEYVSALDDFTLFFKNLEEEADEEALRTDVTNHEEEIDYMNRNLFSEKSTDEDDIENESSTHTTVDYSFKKGSKYKITFNCSATTAPYNCVITNVFTRNGNSGSVDIIGGSDQFNSLVLPANTPVIVEFEATGNADRLHYYSNYENTISISIDSFVPKVDNLYEEVEVLAPAAMEGDAAAKKTTKDISFPLKITVHTMPGSNSIIDNTFIGTKHSIYVRLPWEMLPGHTYKVRLELDENTTLFNVGVVYFGYYDDDVDYPSGSFNIVDFYGINNGGINVVLNRAAGVTYYDFPPITPDHKLTHFHYYAKFSGDTNKSGISDETPTILSVGEKVINNFWAGKKIVWLGTSVPFGAGTLEEDANKRTSYPYMASKALGFKLVPAFVPGLGIQAYKDSNGLVYPHIYGSSCLSKAEYAAAKVAGVLKVEENKVSELPELPDDHLIPIDNFPLTVTKESYTPDALTAVDLQYPTTSSTTPYVYYKQNSLNNYTIWTISLLNFIIQDFSIYYIPGGSSNHYYCTWENIFTQENADADLWVFDILPNNRVYEYNDWNAFGKNTDKNQWAYTDDSSFEDHRFTCIGALLFLLDKLYTLNPKARIVLWRGSNHGYDKAKVNLETVAAKWNITIVDIFKKLNTIPIKNPETNNLYVYGDGLHPSVLGQEILGKYAIRELMNLGG